MGLEKFTDAELSKIMKNSKEFFSDIENVNRLLGLDSITKQRFANVLESEKGISAEEAKNLIDTKANSTISSINVY